MSPKGPPFEFFVILQQNACLEIKKGPLFYIFRYCATFSGRKFFFENFKFFSKKNVLRFFSLRYSADFRRSRLICFFFIFVNHVWKKSLLSRSFFDQNKKNNALPLRFVSSFQSAVKTFPVLGTFKPICFYKKLLEIM